MAKIPHLCGRRKKYLAGRVLSILWAQGSHRAPPAGADGLRNVGGTPRRCQSFLAFLGQIGRDALRRTVMPGLPLFQPAGHTSPCSSKNCRASCAQHFVDIAPQGQHIDDLVHDHAILVDQEEPRRATPAASSSTS